MSKRAIAFFADFLVVALLASCGGGGSSTSLLSPSPTGSPAAQPSPASSPLTINTNAILPGALQGHSYSTTLTALNGVAPLNWSISKVSGTALFVDGLSIDSGTGVLSGTTNFLGTAGFIAQVTDSASPPKTATQGFYVTASTPLQVSPTQSANAAQYAALIPPIAASYQGGVAPLTFTMASGALPQGLRLDNTTGQISGSATTVGTYVANLTIQDSFSTPEIATTQLTVTVVPPNLEVMQSLPASLLLNRPFSGRVVARGGIPPYTFSPTSGTVPPGLSSIDPNSGTISGTPTTLGSWVLAVTATDSSSPPQHASGTFGIAVVKPLGRNDSPATATLIGNGAVNARISPYIDPPNGVPFAGDNDYYKLVSLGGSTVHLETQAKRSNSGDPLDTVLEVVDGNGVRLTTCRQPGDTSTNFASQCLNNDIGSGVQDSALDLQVPGPANSATTFYAHVLDWRGDARPDMSYGLQVSGLVSPLMIQSSPLLPAAHGLSYSQQLSASNGSGSVSWSLISGSIPPGLTLGNSGAITGAATADGTYNFTVRASDSASPPQTAVAAETIQVVEPVKIISSATFPDACVNQPYSFAVQTSGGLLPLYWGFVSNSWVAINLNQGTGIFSGTTNVIGTFTGNLSVSDVTTHGVSQQVTLTVKQCP